MEKLSGGQSKRWSTSLIALWAAVNVLAAMGVVLAQPSVVSHAVPPGLKEVSGDLGAVVEDFESKIPRRHSEGYGAPTPAERSQMAAAWDAVEVGDLERAASIASGLSYEVVHYTDTATGRTSILLQERRRRDGSWPHGWGLFVSSPQSPSAVVTEVPHPLSDVHTPAIGVTAFRRGNGRALLIAGAHRYANRDGSADVAHRSDSVFEAIHQAALSPSSRVHSVHGFTTTAPAPDIVVSRGARPTRTTTVVRDALIDAGFSVCLFDGEDCTELAGTSNVQGQSSRAVGVEFVHVEAHRAVRDDMSRRLLLSETIADALG